MAQVFEDWSEGQALKTAAALAIAACALAAAAGMAAERFAERRLEGAGVIAAPVVLRPPANVIDYAATGSIADERRRALVILGPCGKL